MKIAVPRETAPGERRVALTPNAAAALVKSGLEVLVEAGAGEGAFHSDAAFEKAGARIVPDAATLYGQGDVVLKVQKPALAEADQLREGVVLVSFLQALTSADLEETSEGVRHEMWLMACAMAATDHDLADAEKALLAEWADAFGIAAKDQARGLEIAREWIVDQALDASYADGKLDKQEQAEIRQIAAALGVPKERVDRLDARCRKRRGIY